MSERNRWRWVWCLAALPLLGWWFTGLFDLDEGFYGAIAAEMNRRGEWITPFYNGKPWFEKPILLYWLAKPAIALFGESFGPRLPDILCTFATYLIVGWFARRHFAERIAQIAVLILASSLLTIGAGRMMLTDPPLVLCLTGAMATFWESLVGVRRWRLATAAFLGLGVLAKGPVACILFALIAGWTFAREVDLRSHFRGQWLAGTAILVAVVSAWYVPAYLANGQLFVQKFLIEQNVGRFTGGDAAHTLGIASLPLYIPILLLGMAPWSGWLFKAWPRKGAAEPVGRYLAAWAAVVFLFFSLSGAKLPHYILPVVPPLSILVARYLETKRDGGWKLAVAMCVFMCLFANGAFFAWYSLSGQREAHALARYIRKQGGDVAVYQLPRRQKALGTGKPKLQETSLPSLLLYFNANVIDAEKFDKILDHPGPVWIFTRSGRILPEDFVTVQLAGRRLEEVKTTLDLQNFALYRVR